MSVERSRIIPVEEQHNLITQVQSLADYNKLYRELFSGDQFVDGNIAWITKVHSDISDASSPDYWRLLALNAMLGAQFGFATMYGQILRHHDRHWSLKTLYSTQHQLALGVYQNAGARNEAAAGATIQP